MSNVRQEAEAPERIYLVPFGKPIREPLPQEGSDPDTIWSTQPYGNVNAGNIEYIRADVFLKKADEFLGTLFHPDDTELRQALLEKFHRHINEGKL